MRKHEFKIFCDICKVETSSIYKDIEPDYYHVIFSNEQTEGRACKPYLSKHKLDICHKCEAVMISGKMIFGKGVMGYNDYYFKE